jgi:hypothetical protein
MLDSKRKKMKYLKYIYVLLFIMFASCDVNDVAPLDEISETEAYSTPEKIELSMNGVYDAAQSGFFGGNEDNNRGYIFGAAHVEQNDMRGEDMLLINIFYAYTYQATFTETTANNVNYWENGFRLINLANLFMEGVQTAVEGGVIDDVTGNAYIAEARLLRAMAYQEMVIMFARPYLDGSGAELGLPIRTVGVNSAATVDEQMIVGRSTVAEVYDFILGDLDYAETNLPAERGAQVTRATKGAAIALKTRVYLHMGNWGSVISEAAKLVPASAPYISPIAEYRMTSSVEGPWADNESTDNIFSMGMSETDNLNVNSVLANMLGSSASELGARGEVAISPILWNETFWHEDDLRRTIGTSAEDLGMVYTGANGRLFTTKYRDYTTYTDYAPIIRYTEVILNLAEAEARGGDQTRALALLNAVRDRAKSGAMESYTGLTGVSLIQAILNERRIEFLAEGLRWKDIHRNMEGIPAKMISADVDGSSYVIGITANLPKSISAISYDDSRYLWPIPASETSSNPTLAAQQNPGYGN